MSTLNDTLTVTIGGVEKTFFMSYNRLRMAVAVIGGNAELLETSGLDPETADQYVCIALAEKIEGSQKLIPIDLDEVEIDLQTYEQANRWVLSHIADFFVKRLQGVADLVTSNVEQIKALQSSTAGSAASILSPPAAGPSEPSPPG